MTLSKALLILVCCLAATHVTGAEPPEPAEISPNPDQSTGQSSDPAESIQAQQERCAKAAKKARRKSLWATFLLSALSGASNTMSATQKSNVTFTDDTGRKTKGTVTFVDPVKRDYLNARDSENNANAAMEIYRNSMQKAGCL